MSEVSGQGAGGSSTTPPRQPASSVFSGGRQRVYRQERDREFQIEPGEGLQFKLVAGPADLGSCGTVLRSAFGLVGCLKACLKVATSSRMLYIVISEDRIVNWGWISLSFCRYYPVAEKDVVFGPVQTEAACRGNGYATWGLKHAMNALVRRGYRVFFIDTSHDNLAMQRVIDHCGFGAPISSYLREGGQATSRPEGRGAA